MAAVPEDDLPNNLRGTTVPEDDLPSAPKQETGAAFGIYPKQRATPSKPETKQAMTRFAETTGELLGLGSTQEPEFSPGQIGTAGAVGATGGAVAPKVFRGAGSVLSRIPTLPTRALGAGLTAFGTGLQQTSTARRAALGDWWASCRTQRFASYSWSRPRSSTWHGTGSRPSVSEHSAWTAGARSPGGSWG
jgi:hypothetical protein